MRPLTYVIRSQISGQISSELVRASRPRSGASYFTGLDRMCQFWQTSIVFSYDYPIELARLRDALAETLSDFPELAGCARADGNRFAIDWNDAGAQLSYTKAPAELPRGRVGSPLREWTGALCDKLPASKVKQGKAPLLALRVTHYPDGSSALGMSWPHAIGDAGARYAFLLDLSARMRGERPPARKPGTRAQITNASEAADDAALAAGGASAELRGRWPNTKVLMRVVARGMRCETANILVSGDAIARMAEEARRDASTRISRQDALTASVWRAVHGGRDVPLYTSLIFNIRALKELELDRELFGNAVVSDFTPRPLAAGEQPSLGSAASLVREAYRGMSADFARRQIAFMRRVDEESRIDEVVITAVERCLDDAMMFNNWSKFPSYQIDMGSGPPVWFDVPRAPIPRLVVAKPHPTDRNGVDLHVTLSREARARVVAAMGPDAVSF